MARRSFNPTFKVNLIKVFNRSYGGESKELRNKLRGTLSNRAFRQQFAKSIIDRIVERTHQGIDKKGQAFAAYSKSYKASDIFQIYGKTSHVNLELTGEMLSSLKGVTKLQEISIELIGAENRAKAHGHVHGIRSKRGRVKRDFLGLPDEDLDAIMIESIEQFRHDSYADTVNMYKGLDFAQQFGQVGDQPEFSTSISINDVLAMMMRNLNGQ